MKHKTEQTSIKINIQERPLQAGLYLIGTPIGCLKDISLHALEIFASVDVVACEDTRITGKLLHHYGIQVKKIKYNDHSDTHIRSEILKRIEQGESVALCSDAGLPLIADPGYKLITDCRDKGFYITSIPGANAALTGLQLSGLPTDRFIFLGFLPTKKKARHDYLSQWKDTPVTQIYYETAQRIEETLHIIQDIMGDRPVVIARELTKLFEETLSGSAKDLLEQLHERPPLKGEVVLLLAGQDAKQDWSDIEITELLQHAINEKHLSLKDAVQAVMLQSGWSKKKVYEYALHIKNK